MVNGFLPFMLELTVSVPINSTYILPCALPQVQGDTKKRELLKNPTKIEEIQEKKILTEIEPLKLAF